MLGWRRRLGCRRREVAAMTTVSCLLLLSLYTLALTWCIALPQGPRVAGEEGAVVGMGVVEMGGEGVEQQQQQQQQQQQDPSSPFIVAARKLQFDPAQRSLSSSSNNDKTSSSSSSASSSRHQQRGSGSGKDRAGGGGGGGNNVVQRHPHRTLKFSRNSKDGYGLDNNNVVKGGGGVGGGGYNNAGVRTMHHPHSADSSSSSSSTRLSNNNNNRHPEAAPPAIYLDEDSEEESEDPGQDYREGPGSNSRNRNNHNNNTLVSGTRRLPGAIIIGVKKAGTRALLEFLRIHPDVQAPGPEPHFFDRNYNRGLDWYRSVLPPTEEGQMTMEKTPSYFITREVPKRLQAMSRDVKLLVVVRDPVTRAISDYVQALSKRDGQMKPFEDMALLDHRLGIVNTSWGAIRIGVYTRHLERWFKYFPRKQFHFVSGEQLIANPAQVMKDVQEFLGLPQFIGEKHFYLNATRGFPCLVKFPENNSKPHCLGKTKGRRHPDVDPRVIERLKGFYRPFNAKFYQMVGRDFGWS